MKFEFYAVGKPPSVNKASTKKKDDWKDIVRSQCAATIAKRTETLTPLPFAKSSLVKAYFFPPTKQYFDLDNGLKYTLDAINHATASEDAKRLGLPVVPQTLVTDDCHFVRIIAERVVLRPGASLVTRIHSVPVLMGAYQSVTKARAAGSARLYGVAIKVEPFRKHHGPVW